MEIKYRDHYNDEYFTGKKIYHDHEGNARNYHGPALQWEGFQVVAGALAALWKPGSLLDIGCSGGDLASRLMQKGFDCYGVEISEYAIMNCVSEMKGRIALADISETPNTLRGWDLSKQPTPPFQDKFDYLIATDLLEHIYREDLDNTFDWMTSKADRFFYCVATVSGAPGEKSFIAKKGEPIPPEFEGSAVSGHVNIQSYHKFWIPYFKSKGLKIDWEKMYMFQALRERHQGWKNTGGWSMLTTVFLEKV